MLQGLYRYDPLLPGPDDYQDNGRRLGGPKRNVQNDQDYAEYCNLYRAYVTCREPFFNKPEWIPIPQAQPDQPRLPGLEALVAQRKADPGYERREPEVWAKLQAQLPDEYAKAWQELEHAIEELANCNYVHNFGGPAHTRSVWLYDYQNASSNGGIDVVQDVTFENRMLPTPGGPEVERVGLRTEYFNGTVFDGSTGINYVPERQQIVDKAGGDEAGVTQTVEPPVKRGRGQAYELCMSISRHPATAQKYASLLWAAVFQTRK